MLMVLFGYPDSIDVYVQYFNPSFQFIKTSIDFQRVISFTNVSSDITNDFYYASDFPKVLTVSFIVLFSLLLLFNGLTRLVHKGGLLFG